MIEIKSIDELWYTNPKCNCCTEKAEVVILFIKDVMNDMERPISLCKDCCADLQKKLSEI